MSARNLSAQWVLNEMRSWDSERRGNSWEFVSNAGERLLVRFLLISLDRRGVPFA